MSLTCRAAQDKFGCLTFRQASLISGTCSVVFAMVIIVHEVVLEGGLNLRNYVVLAFCFVWLIVTTLLFIGIFKRAHFLLLPWMIFTSMLIPIFMVGIVAGAKIIATCMKFQQHIKSCSHEYHIFGTEKHGLACVKLALLITMFLLNTGFVFIVYKHFMQLLQKVEDRLWKEVSRKEQYPSLHVGLVKYLLGLAAAQHTDRSPSVRYQRFTDELDPETHVPLCDEEEQDDPKETIT